MAPGMLDENQSMDRLPIRGRDQAKIGEYSERHVSLARGLAEHVGKGVVLTSGSCCHLGC